MRDMVNFILNPLIIINYEKLLTNGYFSSELVLFSHVCFYKVSALRQLRQALDPAAFFLCHLGSSVDPSSLGCEK